MMHNNNDTPGLRRPDQPAQVRVLLPVLAEVPHLRTYVCMYVCVNVCMYK